LHIIAPNGPPPRIPVRLRDQPVIYFLTFCAANRQKVLANDLAFAAFKAALARLTRWNIIAAILMANDVHLLIAPRKREAAVWKRLGSDQAIYASGSEGEVERLALSHRLRIGLTNLQSL
jgi:hypothetical protein